MTHDMLIRDGLLLDGTGAAGRLGDLAIRDGRIVAMGTDLGADAAKLIDATGLAVAPGFIDIKTHSDFTLPINPRAESKVRQGLTTEIIGHCGFSVAPALPGKVELLRDYLSPSAPWLPFKETTFPAYLDDFPATAVNAGMLVGHNTLRLMVMGMADRPPTPDELAQMIALLEEALGAGALGLSSGLFTAPGSYAQPAEMIALCRVVKRHNAGYFTHIRDEANRVLEAVEEAIAIAEACGVHVEIVHFKCSGTDNWGKATRALDMIAAAKARGLDVDCDSYPYAGGSNPLKNVMPQWVQAVGVAAMLERLAAKPTRARIIGHYAGELGLIPPELAVHKMTGATARALKLRDRGLLRDGYCADVTIFDPADFRDRATYADPHQYPTGARTTVIVNGTVVIEDATHTGALPGKVLRRDGDGRVG